MRLFHVVSARPNFTKLAPVHRAASAIDAEQIIVHAGQHYDDQLSGGFFRDLGIPVPDVNLLVGSETHALQTARTIERLEPLLLTHRPDWVLVYGDVNSTMAAALCAATLGIPLAHVDAGLRSHDRTMQEEINRVVTDRLADLLFTSSRDADETLRAEGEPEEEIVFVGNVTIDSLLYALPRARATKFRQQLPIDDRPIVVTVHRASNVDDPDRLRALGAALSEIASERSVIFPMEPRTRQRLREARADLGDVLALEPLAYLQMLDLVSAAHAVITDSSGLQEETTGLGIPCLTLRESTERSITITEGTNQLAPDPLELPSLVRGLVRPHQPRRPEGWDGHAGTRIVHALSTRALRVYVGSPASPTYAVAI